VRHGQDAPAIRSGTPRASRSIAARPQHERHRKLVFQLSKLGQHNDLPLDDRVRRLGMNDAFAASIAISRRPDSLEEGSLMRTSRLSAVVVSAVLASTLIGTAAIGQSTTISSNFNGTSVTNPEYVWFTSHLTR